MAKNLFAGKQHAAVYAKYRPVPPQQLIDRIVQYTQEKIPPPLASAVDVGCGSGQSSLCLTPYFKHVLGTDISNSQLTQARKAAEKVPNVAFGVARAEELPMENSTVQLITASQCFHWFDMDKFYSECKRILVPNGVLAAYAYLIPQIRSGNDEVDKKIYEHLMKIYSGTLGGYWDSARSMVDQRYRNIQLPFNNALRVDGIWASKTSTVADYQGYLSSWSAYQNYAKDKGQQTAERMLTDFTKKVMECLQSPKSPDETTIQVDIEYFLLMGRNPAEKN